MIVDAFVATVFVLAGWWLLSWALLRVEAIVENEDPFSAPTAQDRAARRRRARWRALAPFAAPWVFWGPMLAFADTPPVIGLLLAAGSIAGVAATFGATTWRLVPGTLLCAAGAVLQLGLLAFLGGLVAEARLDPETLAQRATVVEMRRLGRAWWEWSAEAAAAASAEEPAANDVEGAAPRETDAALLLADRALGWPALRGLVDGRPLLIDAGAYPELDPVELERLLTPRFLPRIPLVDGWGRPLEVRGWLEPRDRTLPRFLVRSAGADGRFEEVVRAGPFPAELAGEDIVWADGAFLREPEPAMAAPE